MNKGVLLDAGGRAMGKDKGLAKSEAREQALEISYDPDGLFPEVDESSASMMIDRRLGMRQAEKEKEMEEEMKKEHEEARESFERDSECCRERRTGRTSILIKRRRSRRGCGRRRTCSRMGREERGGRACICSPTSRRR